MPFILGRKMFYGSSLLDTTFLEVTVLSQNIPKFGFWEDNVRFSFVVVNLNCQPEEIKNHLGNGSLGMPAGDDFSEGPRESKTMPRKNKTR